LKVLLTGANGFVGSHILDALRARGVATAILLRPSSSREFIEPHLPRVEVRLGAVSDPASLREAVRDVSHVIHCAGATKALRRADFWQVNHLGTRNVVAAVNERSGQIERVVHISSLAAAGPALPERPAREDDPPYPVSEYGRSKLAGEREMTEGCKAGVVVLRPPAVYGPRDREFLRLFRAVKHHFLPRFVGGVEALSLLYVTDLADAAVAALSAPAALGQTYFVSPLETASVQGMTRELARQMGVWTVSCPVPAPVLWPLCLAQEGWSRLTGKPAVLSLQKYAELTVPGWVCDGSKLERELGSMCATRWREGLAKTLAWYNDQHWL
jgi:dihydroflavonol-4-reductase